MKIVVGVTGATGILYAVRLLEAMNQSDEIQTHLIMSEWAIKNVEIETTYSLEYIYSLSTEVHDNKNLGAKTSSGSFLTDGMIIVPAVV
jgi:4-hydroxy-3-polyprenylbenzoate decarboxylase